MRHCCKFAPDDTYYLEETNLFTFRTLSIGFCPICGKPVVEIYQIRFDGKPERLSYSGVEASEKISSFSKEILYSIKELNYKKTKSKPFGWRYGLNRSSMNNKTGKVTVSQYACDFYGNKELIKKF